jgi:hypothetical protein
VPAKTLKRRAFFVQTNARYSKSVAQKWLGIPGNQAGGRPNFRNPSNPGMVAENPGEATLAALGFSRDEAPREESSSP